MAVPLLSGAVSGVGSRSRGVHRKIAKSLCWHCALSTEKNGSGTGSVPSLAGIRSPNSADLTSAATVSAASLIVRLVLCARGLMKDDKPQPRQVFQPSWPPHRHPVRGHQRECQAWWLLMYLHSPPHVASFLPESSRDVVDSQEGTPTVVLHAYGVPLYSSPASPSHLYTPSPPPFWSHLG